MDIQQRTFHLHMISDATGETLVTIARAVGVQYAAARAIEHLHPLVRSGRELDRVLKEVEAAPGIVLYTLFNRDMAEELEQACKRLNVPYVAPLLNVLQVFESYLGMASTPMVGGQHQLDADYYRRIEALNFSMMHDDGHLPDRLDDADIILLGISRTSKTPTSIYLANRGVKAANVPIVPDQPLPDTLFALDGPLVVGLTEDPRRLVDIRRSRMRLSLGDTETDYTDLDSVRKEVAEARRLFSRHGWPVIDVTRRSIEETAAAILRLVHERDRRHEDGTEGDLLRSGDHAG